MKVAKSLADYSSEYSYGTNDARLQQIYREMWEGGYRVGEDGRYLRCHSKFEENKLFSILKGIAYWKSGGEWWSNQGFDNYWSFPKIRSTFRNLVDLKKSVTKSKDEKVLSIIAVNPETKISGFGLRSGSVIMTVMYPDSYGIIDYKAWRALNGKWAEQYDLEILCKLKNECGDCYGTCCKYDLRTEGSADFDLAECGQYFDEIRKIGVAEEMNPRQVDMALWEYDRQYSRS